MNDIHGLKLDNPEKRLRYYELILERKTLEDLPRFSLPSGYRFAFYQPGDREAWLEIERSAGELVGLDDGLEAWNHYYGGREAQLGQRMIFVETDEGEKVATATAFYEPDDPSGAGWLHWVAVKKTHQGRGLSKPLIAKALRTLRALGYTHAKIPTQTTTWVAVGIYLDFGFLPFAPNAAHQQMGWRIAAAVTGHPALAGFDPATPQELLDPVVCAVLRALWRACPDLQDSFVYTEKGAYVRYRTPEGVFVRAYRFDGQEASLGAPQPGR